MTACFLLFRPLLIASFYISPWLPLLLSSLACALLLAWLWGLWSSAQLLSGSSGKTLAKNGLTTTKSGLRLLKAQQALNQLRLIGPRLAIVLTAFALGYLYHDYKEFHNTYVLTNAVVDQQNGDYVTYHFEEDPTREPYTLNFSCSHYKPYFKPHQIIAKMTYARKEDCESLDGPQYVLKLRRNNGVPILEGE